MLRKASVAILTNYANLVIVNLLHNKIENVKDDYSDIIFRFATAMQLFAKQYL
jgi:hypothetical protein